MDIQNNEPETQAPKPGIGKTGIIILLIIVLSYTFGYQVGKKGFVFKPKDFKVVNQANQPKEVNYQLLWDAINVINNKYIERPVDQQKILYGAIRGAVQATGDPYTDFFEPKQAENFKSDLEGEFSGIGAEISKKNGVIVIVAPLADTPAEKAGLLPQDIIAEVNGKSTQDWSVEQAINEIRGPKGTQVKLTIVRAGKDAPINLTITRDTIEVKSVKWQIKEVSGKKVMVISVSKFGADTKKLFDQALNESLTKSVQGIVVDLRNNPGGYLNTAVDLASNWVENGKLVVKEKRADGESDYNASGNSRMASMKTVILINGGSASASEIFSGALHDYKLATLVGEKSFGKGSVQELVDLTDGSSVKVTIAKWITPGGKNLNKDGLVPDIEVKLTEEDFATGKDPQMDRALEEVVK
jgi:carboxyl-terminal processing protease